MIRPLHDRLLIRILPWGSGAIIAPGAADGFRRGRVLAAGPGKLNRGRRLPLSVGVGEVVWVGRLDDYCDHDEVIIREADILVVEEEGIA